MKEPGLPIEELTHILQSSPFHRLFQMAFLPTDTPDALSLRMEFTSEVERIQGGGQYHGGVLASLGDIAGAFVIGHAIGVGGITLQFSINYLRPAIATAVIAHARIRRLSKTVGFVDIDIEAEHGEDVAVCRGVYALSRR